MNDDVSVDAKKEAKPESKTVPLQDLLAVKNRLKSVSEELDTLRSERDREKQERELLEAELNTNPENEDEVKAAKKKLLQKDRELARRESDLKTREGTIARQLREIRAKELGAKHSVDPDVLLTHDDMEKEALRLENERLSREREESKSKKRAGSTVYERGAPPPSQKGVWEMSKEEFTKHLERERAKAFAR